MVARLFVVRVSDRSWTQARPRHWHTCGRRLSAAGGNQSGRAHKTVGHQPWWLQVHSTRARRWQRCGVHHTLLEAARRGQRSPDQLPERRTSATRHLPLRAGVESLTLQQEGFTGPQPDLIQICGSNSRVPLQLGHLPGFDSLCSSKVKPQERHRDGITSI